MIRYNLTSIGAKIFILLGCLILALASYFTIITSDNFSIIIIMPILCTLGGLFGFYLAMNHKILIKDNLLVLKLLRKRIIPIKDILKVYVIDEGLYMNLICIETKEKTYKISGYNSFGNWNYKIKISKHIVDDIQKEINKLQQ